MNGRTHEQYMKEEGPAAAAHHLRYLIMRDQLSKIPDPSATRRKNPALSGDELVLFEHAVESFREREMGRHSYAAIMLQDAFRRNERRTFEIIAMACDYAAEPYQTKHGRNVIAAMDAAAEIMAKENRFPTKHEVKERVQSMLGSDAYDIMEKAQEWTKVFRAARLAWLDSKLPKRGQSRHGDR